MIEMTHTTGKVTMEDFVRRALEPGPKSAGAYFRRQWLTRATRTLAEVRRAAGLTQAQVAAKMGTTQSAIARLENDIDGGISLRRYLDFLIACNSMPLLPETKSLSELREAGLKDLSMSPLDPKRWSAPKPTIGRAGKWGQGHVSDATLPAAAEVSGLPPEDVSSDSRADVQDPFVWTDALGAVEHAEVSIGYRLGGPAQPTCSGGSSPWTPEYTPDGVTRSSRTSTKGSRSMATVEAAA